MIYKDSYFRLGLGIHVGHKIGKKGIKKKDRGDLSKGKVV